MFEKIIKKIFGAGITEDERTAQLAQLDQEIADVDNLIEQAKLEGVNAFILRTDVAAIPARKLYLSLGFVEQTEWHDCNHPNRTYWMKI